MSVKAWWGIIITIMLIMAPPSSGFSQKKTVKVAGIRVEGNKTADAEIVKLTSGLRSGKEISAEDVQRAIKQLWTLGIFSDIQLLLDKETSEGVYLTVKVEEYPRLVKIELEGNKEIKDADLNKELDLYTGQVISPNQVLKARKRLKDLYADKGYLLAQIEAQSLDPEGKGRVTLKFKINEGKKVKIKKIRFLGNDYFSDGKLKKQLKGTKEDRKWWWGGGDFKREKYEEDLEKLISFYRKEGFRDAEVLGDSIYYGPNKKDMFIDIKIREGQRYKIGEITWEGNRLYNDKELSAVLGLEEGDVYNQEKLQKTVTEKLAGLYYDRGYIYAQIIPQEIPLGKDRVNIHFIIEEGNPVTVNKIIITGNTKTKDKVIRRELRIRPGDVFSRAALMRSQRDVWILNYFANVVPDVQRVDDKKVNLVFEVEEKSTDTANMSAGWSERDRLIGSIGVSMNNLFGNGQRLSFDWNFGRYYRSFQIGFTEPWLLDTPTLAGFSFYDTKRSAQWYGYKQRSRGGSLRFGRRFSWPDNYSRGDWIYRIDQTLLSDFSAAIRQRNPNNIVEEYKKGPLTSSSITQIFSRDSRDKPEFPTSGSVFSLSTEIAGGILGGNVGYHKHVLSTQWYFPLLWKLVLFSEAQAGFIDGFTKASKVPYLELFFMGGAGMSRSIPLRGYDDPLYDTGGYIYEGGRTMLKYAVELRFPIVENPTAFGLLFAEAGNTWKNLSNTDPFDLRRSVGFGARIFMPMIGVLGFDYAYGFDNYDKEGRRRGAWKPHFVFGRGF